MNLISEADFAGIVRCFMQGRSIRATEQLIGVHRDTVMRYFRILREEVSGQPGDVSQNIVVHAFSCLQRQDIAKLLYPPLPNQADRRRVHRPPTDPATLARLRRLYAERQKTHAKN